LNVEEKRLTKECKTFCFVAKYQFNIAPKRLRAYELTQLIYKLPWRCLIFEHAQSMTIPPFANKLVALRNASADRTCAPLLTSANAFGLQILSMLQCDFPDKRGSQTKRRPMARLPAAGILVERSIVLFLEN
jgi:hypothetical protein